MSVSSKAEEEADKKHISGPAKKRYVGGAINRAKQEKAGTAKKKAAPAKPTAKKATTKPAAKKATTKTTKRAAKVTWTGTPGDINAAKEQKEITILELRRMLSPAERGQADDIVAGKRKMSSEPHRLIRLTAALEMNHDAAFWRRHRYGGLSAGADMARELKVY